jgi:propionate CoA-transferase
VKRNKVITVDEAVRVILNNDTVAISGFGQTGVPEELAMALETRFLETGAPRDLTLIYAEA